MQEIPISILAPLAGRDGGERQGKSHQRKFQSSRPLRGATEAATLTGARAPRFQSSRPLRGATIVSPSSRRGPRISILAPLAGRDWRTGRTHPDGNHFNPRAPCGARLSIIIIFSIVNHFNPRAPCGARPPCGRWRRGSRRFQSSRPLRGATDRDAGGPRVKMISILAPLAGRDRDEYISDWALSFISILAPLAGRDSLSGDGGLQICNFNPRAPCGARPPKITPAAAPRNFNPRAPCGARQV